MPVSKMVRFGFVIFTRRFDTSAVLPTPERVLIHFNLFIFRYRRAAHIQPMRDIAQGFICPVLYISTAE